MPTDDVDEFLARVGASHPVASTQDPRRLQAADSLRSLLIEPGMPEETKAQIRRQLGQWGLGEATPQGDDVDAFLGRVLPAEKPLFPDLHETIAKRDFGTPAGSFLPDLQQQIASTDWGTPTPNVPRGTTPGTPSPLWEQHPVGREEALAAATEMGLPPYAGPTMRAGREPYTELPPVPEAPTPWREYPGMIAGAVTGGITAGAAMAPALAGAAMESGATHPAPPFGPRMVGPAPRPQDLEEQRQIGERFFAISRAIQEAQTSGYPQPSGPLAHTIHFIGSAPGYWLNPLMRAAGAVELPVAAGAGRALGLEADTTTAVARIAKLGQYFVEGAGRTPEEIEAAKAMVSKLEGELPGLVALRQAVAKAAGRAASGAIVGAATTVPQEGEDPALYAFRAGVSATAVATLFGGLSLGGSALQQIRTLLAGVGVQPDTIVRKLGTGERLTDQEREIVERVAVKVEHDQAALPAGPVRPQLPAEAGPTRLPWLGQPAQPPATPSADPWAYLRQFKPWITDAEIDSTDDPGRLMQVATDRIRAYKEQVLEQHATPEEQVALSRPGAPRLLILKAIEDRIAQNPPTLGTTRVSPPAAASQPPAVQPAPQAPPSVTPPVAPAQAAPEELEYQKSADALKKMLEQQPSPAQPVPPAETTPTRKPPAGTTRSGTIAAGLGHWWEQILEGGPLKYKHIAETAGPEIAKEISKRFPGGTIVAKEGQQLDEVAERLVAQGFEGGDAVAARNKILGMLEDLAKMPKTGRAVVPGKGFGKPDPSIGALAKTEYAGNLKDGEEILTADGNYWTVTAGRGKIDLTRGDGKKIALDEFDPVQIVSHLSVSEKPVVYGARQPERRMVENAPRRTAIDQMKGLIEANPDYEPHPDLLRHYPEIAAHLRNVRELRSQVLGSEARAKEIDQALMPGIQKPLSQQAMIEERLREQKRLELAAKLGDRGEVGGPLFEPKEAGLFPPGTKGVSEATSKYDIEPFQKAPEEMKRHLMAVGGYHMKRGATDIGALTTVLSKTFGPAIEPYVPGLHDVLSKLPAFAPKGAQHEPVRVGHAQQQPAGAAGGVRLRPAEGKRPAARPPSGGEAQPPQETGQRAQGAGATAPYAPEPAAAPTPGIITISRELVPPHSPEDAGLLKRLSSPQGLADLRQQLGGRTPMSHQIDAFVRIRRAHLDGHGYVLADGTGTGKTTVAALTISDLLKEKPQARVLVVLRNPDLVRQWTSDVLSPMRAKTNLYRGAFGYAPRTVNFLTYATMERLWSSDQFGKVTEGFKPDLLIFDESHALKNFYTGDTSTALAGERLQTFAGRVLHLSATPFESALHTGYASGLKLWWPEKDWRSFMASAFDIYYDSQHGLWMGLSPKKLKAIHGLLYSSNRMLKNEMDFGAIRNSHGDPVTLTTENLFAPRTEAQRAEHERISEFFPGLIEQLQVTPGTKPSHIRLVRGLEYMVHRSLDEAQKLPHAIEHARRAVEQGKSVIFMLLRKGDTSMERWMQEYESGERTYKPYSKMPEFIAAMNAHGIEIPSPVRTLEAAFPGAVKITGDQPAGGPLRRSSIDRFQSGDAQVAIVTMPAGAEGLNLQDRIGNHPRAMYVISVPYNATQATQVAGRPFRVGSESNAETFWLFNDTPVDRRVAGALAETLRNQHAILHGQNVVPTADEIERFQFPELNVETAEPEPPVYSVAEEQMALRYETEKKGLGVPVAESFIKVETKATGQQFTIPHSTIRGPEDVAAIFDGLKTRPTEAAYVLYMRGKTPIAAEMIGMGSINHASTEPRYVLSAAKHLGADGVIFAHNHPSGSPEASADDRALTRTYANALEPWGIKVIGHVVVDIERFGWVLPNGTFEIRDLDASRLAMRAGSVPVVEPSMRRLEGRPGQMMSSPAEAAAYYLTRLKDRATVSTLFIAADAQRKISGTVLIDGGPTAILGDDEATNAVRHLIADTMPLSIVAVTNEPTASPVMSSRLTTAVHEILGPGPAKAMLDDVIFADTSGVQSGDIKYMSSRDRGFMYGPSTMEPGKTYAISEPDRIKARQAIIDEFLQALETTARVGRMGFMPRSIRAFYSARTGVIRQRLHGDIEAAVVEGGRRIYDLLFRLAPGGRLEDVGPKLYRRFKSELSALARPSAIPSQPIEQGFAHFIRMYVTEPATAKAVAPEFLPWFEAHLEETAPKIKYALDALRSDWADYRRADPIARGHLTIQSSTLPLGRIKSGTPFERAYDAIFDSMAPVRRVTNDLLKLRGGGKIPASEDARDLAQIVTARFALAQHMWETGIGLFGKPGEIVSPAPKELARAVGPDWKDYELYAKARRGMEEVKRGFDMERDVGLEQDSADAALKRFHEEHKGNFAKARSIFKAILAWHRDAGFMTDVAYEEAVRSHPDYSALYRVMDEEIQARGGAQQGPGSRHTGLWSAIRRFKGSPRPTIASLEAMAKMLYTVVDRGERNNLAAKLVQLGLSTTGGGRYIEEVPEERWPTIVPVRKALAELQRLGITPRDVDIPESALDDRLVFFQPSWMTPPRPYDWVWIKGRRRLFRFPEPVYDALRGLNREPMNFVTKWLSYPAAVLRAGAVGYVPAAWAWIQMKKVPVDFIETGGPLGLAHRLLPALFSMLGKDKEYDKFMRSGAAMAGFVTSNVTQPELSVRREIAKTAHPGAYWSNPFNVLHEAIAFSRYLAFSVESAARLAEAQGIWPKDAATRAQLTPGAIRARNLGVDYSVRGSVTGLINQYVPFFTAPLSGLRSAGKAMHDRPARTALQWLFFSATLTTWLWFHNRKQKSYKELSPAERFKNLHWADDENLTSPIRIMPRAFVFGQADALLEGALDWVDQRDPQAIEDFAAEIAKNNDLLARSIPTAALPVLENFGNARIRSTKDLLLHTGAPVSPERGLLSEAYYPWTTETAKSMGRALNYPPAKIEHLAQGWLGTAGTTGLQVADFLTGRPEGSDREKQGLPFLGRFLTYPGRATADSLTRVYEMWDESERAYQSYRYKVQHEPDAASEFFLKNEDLIQRYYRLRGQVKRLGAERRAGQGIPDINRDARAILDREQAIHVQP